MTSVASPPLSVSPLTMSTLKIERDTVRKGTETVANAAAAAKDTLTDGQIPGTSGKHPHLEKIGTAITGGKGNAGTKGYLMVCVFVTPWCRDLRTVPAHLISHCTALQFTNDLNPIGLHQAARREPTPNQDAHSRHPCRSSGVPRIMASQGSQQAWKLLHIPSAQDGRLRCPR